MSSVGLSRIASPEVLAQLRDMTGGKTSPQPSADSKAGQSFSDLLSDGIKEVNNMQKSADKQGMDVASGKSGELHDAMLASTQAELSFNLMVQIRNRALEAYQEVMRMPV